MAATVLDAFYVTLGLDAKNFNAGNQDAIAAMGKTRDEVKRTGAEIDKRTKETQAEQKKQADAAAKQQKELNESGKQIAETIGKVGKAALTLLTAFTAGRGIKEFIAYATDANAALGRLAPNIGVSVESLSGWENAVKAMGGAAGEASAGLGSLTSIFERWKRGIGSDTFGVLNRLGIGPEDLADANSAMAKIAVSLQKVATEKGRAFAVNLSEEGLHFSEGLTNLLLDPDYAKKVAAGAGRGVNGADTAAAITLQTAEETLKQSLERLGNTILTDWGPTIVAVLNRLKELADWLALPEHHGMLEGIFIAASVAATAFSTVAVARVIAALTGTSGLSAAAGVARSALLGVLGTMGWIIAAGGLTALATKGILWGGGAGDTQADRNAAGMPPAGVPVPTTPREEYERAHPFETWWSHLWGGAAPKQDGDYGVPGANGGGYQPTAYHPGADGAGGPVAGDMSLPRGVRNNNPGNLVYAGQNGATSDGRFAVFRTMADGVAAMGAQLQRYGARGIDTVSGIINTWAPSSENDTGGYIQAVMKQLGVTANAHLNLNDPAVLQALEGAIISQENGAKYRGLATSPGSWLPGGGGRTMSASAATTTVGTVNVYSNAKDAPGIARDIRSAMSRYGVVAMANTGLA